MATVCKITLDAAEYRKELEAVVAESRAAAGSLANLPDRQVSVTADTTQAKAAVEELAQTPTPEIDVPVTADDAPLETVREELEQTDAAARKTGGILAKLIPVSLREQAAQAFGAIREEMNKTRGGAGNFLGKFLAGGGAIGIIAAGIASLGKIAVTAYRNWINGMKEAGELAQRNAANIREAAEANEQLRQKSDGYLSRLSELSSAEQLSNSNKAEARKLIADLTKSYGDLGVKLDETTGKLSGVDEAMVKKLQRDKDRRIAEMETELRQLQSDNAAQAQVRDNAGIPVWFGGDVRLGGEADAKEAGQKIEENVKRMTELRRQLHEQRRSTSSAAPIPLPTSARSGRPKMPTLQRGIRNETVLLDSANPTTPSMPPKTSTSKSQTAVRESMRSAAAGSGSKRKPRSVLRKPIMKKRRALVTGMVCWTRKSGFCRPSRQSWHQMRKFMRSSSRSTLSTASGRRPSRRLPTRRSMSLITTS